ncbi:MAG TPA: class I SAM-dependent methyltransferase [Solirubrobacteraceae bacterium]|nr:class I SAM-dependent methyltransferase [Solirubrobacteraceae bacterium]
MSVYADLVARHGLAESHALLLAAAPGGARVLDVGCAEGYLARALLERGCSVVGVEADPAAADQASRWCEAVVAGDVEDPAVRARIDGPFDRVLFGDVLEHLRDPVGVLRWARGLLASQGQVVASLPNIAHWTARRQLVRGRFPQDDHGLFDRTHLRFFTRASARELFAAAGLRVAAEHFTPAPLPLESRLPALARLRPALVHRRPELFALQIVLIGTR